MLGVTLGVLLYFCIFIETRTSTSLLPTQAEQEYLIFMCIILNVLGGKKLEE
jgi:hypothetical protein